MSIVAKMKSTLLAFLLVANFTSAAAAKMPAYDLKSDNQFTELKKFIADLNQAILIRHRVLANYYIDTSNDGWTITKVPVMGICSMVYKNNNGMIGISIALNDIPNSAMTFISAENTAHGLSKLKWTPYTLDQTEAPSKQVNGASFVTKNGKGAISFNVPPQIAAIADIKDVQEFRVSENGHILYQNTWYDGVNAKHKMLECISRE